MNEGLTDLEEQILAEASSYYHHLQAYPWPIAGKYDTPHVDPVLALEGVPELRQMCLGLQKLALEGKSATEIFEALRGRYREHEVMLKEMLGLFNNVEEPTPDFEEGDSAVGTLGLGRIDKGKMGKKKGRRKQAKMMSVNKAPTGHGNY